MADKGKTSRKYRTPAERLADARAQAAALEASIIEQAVSLHAQATGWRARSEELLNKAEGADIKAATLLEDLGINAQGFFDELDEGSEG